MHKLTWNVLKKFELLDKNRKNKQSVQICWTADSLSWNMLLHWQKDLVIQVPIQVPILLTNISLTFQFSRRNILSYYWNLVKIFLNVKFIKWSILVTEALKMCLGYQTNTLSPYSNKTFCYYRPGYLLPWIATTSRLELVYKLTMGILWVPLGYIPVWTGPSMGFLWVQCPIDIP